MDKPFGTSTTHCARGIAGFIKPAKVGHAGTLDPMATGLVILLVGRATKLFPYMSIEDKCYTGKIYLGRVTSTGDREGDTISVSPVDVMERTLFEIADRLTGIREQNPPAFSAVKYRGKPLYSYARKGIQVETKPRKINVESFRITGIELPEVSFEAVVSKGTYMRCLAEDFGKMAGCGAFLSELRRTRNGRFDVEEAHNFEKLLDSAKTGRLKSYILDMRDALKHMPSVEVDSAAIGEIAHGKSFPLSEIPQSEDGRFKIVDERKVLAIARREDNCFGYRYERVMLRPEEIEN